MTARLARFSGFVLADGRRGGKCWGDRPRCINDHRLVTRDPILAEGVTTCQNRVAGRGTAICGALLYVWRYVPASHPDELCWEMVEITPEHVKRLQQEPMLHLERMMVVGLTNPGVEYDFPEQESA